MDIWKEEVPDNRRIGNIGETRWWSKHAALGKIFGIYGKPETSLFDCLMMTFERLLDILDGKPAQTIKTTRKRLLKFKSILSALTSF